MLIAYVQMGINFYTQTKTITASWREEKGSEGVRTAFPILGKVRRSVFSSSSLIETLKPCSLELYLTALHPLPVFMFCTK
jgi:hypothetical protein